MLKLSHGLAVTEPPECEVTESTVELWIVTHWGQPSAQSLRVDHNAWASPLGSVL